MLLHLAIRGFSDLHFARVFAICRMRMACLKTVISNNYNALAKRSEPGQK